MEWDSIGTILTLIIGARAAVIEYGLKTELCVVSGHINTRQPSVTGVVDIRDEILTTHVLAGLLSVTGVGEIPTIPERATVMTREVEADGSHEWETASP